MGIATYSKMDPRGSKPEAPLDIITGIVIITSSFILGTAIAGVLGARGVPNDGRGSAGTWTRTRAVMALLVVVYFVATSQLLLIAQQPSLAGGNLVVGLVLVVFQFVEPSLRESKQPVDVDERENWRR